ncbi:phage tail protein [Kordiimonas sp.]|uniref:phage tail protein n=1 Tax=Kordiimonas sp. TaxID=1970157 RepID=UPI003A8CEA29
MYDTYIGVIKALGFSFAPENWGYCSGAILAISQFSSLFSLLGCEYGGDCRTVFGLPDLRGRIPVGQFTGPGLTPRVIGQRFGVPLEVLTVSHMPAHSHSVTYGGTGGGGDISVRAATDPAKKQTPSVGDYLAPMANNFGALQDNMFIASSDVATSAELGGFDGGSGSFQNTFLTVNNTGNPSEYVNPTQPSAVLNYCICMMGLYPARS